MNLPKLQRVVVQCVPADQVKVCPMGPSLEQKEKDGTITESEAFVLHALRIHRALESDNEPTCKR